MSKERRKKIYAIDPKLATLEAIEEMVEEMKESKSLKLDGVKYVELKGDPGKDGNDYILTEEDKKEIASNIEVPIVEKVIEKTETIVEKPSITQIVKEVAVADTAKQIAKKINTLDGEIDFAVLKNVPESVEQLSVDNIIKEIKKQKLEMRDIKNMPLNMNDQRWHGSGITEAPKDGSEYVRKNANWSKLTAPSASDEALRMDLGFPGTERYNEFVYDINGNLETINVWDSSLQLTKLFEKDFTYTNGDLTNIHITRFSDMYEYDKQFDYDISGNLVGINAVV